MTSKVGFLLAAVTILSGLDDSEFQNSIPSELVWAVAGNDVELPCDTSPEDNDSLSMVLWFKGASGVPLYSLDARNGSLLHWAMGSNLGGRSYFLLGKGKTPSRLRITRITMEDEGIFRCRVDFINSPTRNFNFNVTLVVMPSEPMVFDNQGREVMGVAGPYLQGYDLFLSCHVVGGKPRPLVTWWRDSELLDDKMESVTQSLSVNHYSRPNVSRDLFNSRLQCRVVISPLVPPLSKEIRLDILLKPEKVAVRALGEVRSAGRPQQFQCESWGAIPSARITWFMDGELVRQATISAEEKLNSTVSVLTYKTAAEDHGRELTCRAENPRFPGSIMEKSLTITVHYTPSVSVVAEQGVDLQALREGDHLTLFCKVRSYPPATHIAWFHGERYLTTNESTSVTLEGISLNLKNLTNFQGGEYSCAARNAEGDARSTPLSLRVQYAPICSVNFISRNMAALRHETIRVRCEVRADPIDVRFRWTFNSSSNVSAISPSQILTLNSTQPTSYVDFTPVSDQDFGTLACWASNRIGFQSSPCVTHIIPAKTPEPPHNCRLDNHSTGGLEVACQAGDDGGLQQHFLLEALESVRTLLDNSSTERYFFPMPVFKVLGSEPTFLLQGLEVGRSYYLRIYAVNNKGQSEPPVIIPYSKIENTSSKLHSIGTTNEDTTDDQSTSLLIILGTLIGVAVLVVCGLAFTTGLLACRKRAISTQQLQRKYENALQEAQEALQRQEDAFVIKIPLPKVNNAARKSMHELQPIDADADASEHHCSINDVIECPAVQTVVKRRNHSTDLKTATVRKSFLEPRRLSLGYQMVTTAANTIDESPTSAAINKVKNNCDGNEFYQKTGESAIDRPILVRTSFMEDPTTKRNHPRVTLDADGQVLRCVLPKDTDTSSEC